MKKALTTKYAKCTKGGAYQRTIGRTRWRVQGSGQMLPMLHNRLQATLKP